MLRKQHVLILHTLLTKQRGSHTIQDPLTRQQSDISLNTSNELLTKASLSLSLPIPPNRSNSMQTPTGPATGVANTLTLTNQQQNQEMGLYYFSSCPLQWGSNLQIMVWLSTTEAEYIALIKVYARRFPPWNLYKN